MINIKTAEEQSAQMDWRPNLFVAGFAKCGTTALCNYLAQHPDVMVPWEKEPNTLYKGETYPPWFTGDITKKAGHLLLDLMNYFELYSKGKEQRYRVDGTVSYTFKNDFAKKLMNFSPNAKVILVVREQKSRLISMYFHSYIQHKQDDFLRWNEDYIVPDMQTILFYDRVLEYYNLFGENVRVIKNDELNKFPQEVLDEAFKFLNLDPMKVKISQKNISIFTPSDSVAYNQLMVTLGKMKFRSLTIFQKLGLEKEFYRLSYQFGNVLRSLLDKTKRTRSNYSPLIAVIPGYVSKVLVEDYNKTIDFSIKKNILLSPKGNT